MRIVIKNADFSSVSIGKVVKDLSFSFDSANGAGSGEGHGDIVTINAFFLNFNSGTPTATTIYAGSEGGTVTTVDNSPNRFVSDFHEVSEGMIINAYQFGHDNNSPNIIAFDEDKNIVSASCKWVSSTSPYDATFVVPNGVKYVKFQQGVSTGPKNQLLNGFTKASGIMPTT